MMDAASPDTTELLLLGNFIVDLMKPQSLSIEKTSTHKLSQLTDTPTRIIITSKTRIDHICATDKRNNSELCVPVYGCGDRLPICLTWNKKE